MEPDDARFLELVSRFDEALRHHASDEESEQFPKLRAQISAEDLVELGSKVEAAKKAAPTPATSVGAAQRAVPQDGRSGRGDARSTPRQADRPIEQGLTSR